MAARAARELGRGSARRCSHGAWRRAPGRCPTAAAGAGARTPLASRPWRRSCRAGGPSGAGWCSGPGGCPSTAPTARSSSANSGRDALVAAGPAGGQRQVAAVGVDVLAEQRDLDDAVGGQPADLVDEIVERTADLDTPHRRHDAERAAVVAADLDRDPRRVALPRGGPAAPTGTVRGRRPPPPSRISVTRSVGAGFVQQLGRPVHVVGAEHDVDVRRPPADRVTVLLGQAAADHDLEVGAGRFERLEVAERAVELVVGVLADAAGVEHDHVGLVRPLGGLQTVGLEQAGDALGVVLVHLAPEGANEIGAGH